MKLNKRTTVATPLAGDAVQRQIAHLTGIDRKTIRRVALTLIRPEGARTRVPNFAARQ